MYKHLLIAIDDSVLAFGALEQGLALAKALDARVTIATVTEPWTSVVTGEAAIGFPIAEYEKSAETSATNTLTRAQKAAANSGVKCDVIHVKDAHAADGILETTKEQDCDLIVMGSHGRRGISRILLGSQANDVVTRSTVPVLICR